ncbi:MAG: hypothetical protein D3919_09410 [Candidatus Electrothrix sp. AW5]|nr:hypothetical protein [Candidatus Electrothrix gigas]
MKDTVLKKRIPLPTLTLIIVGGGGLLSLPSTAAACTVCIFSQFEYALPHIHLWCMGMMIWFCAVRAITGHPFSAVFWSFVGLIAGGAFIGPYAFFLLGAIAFCITIKTWLPKKRRKLSKASRIALLVVTTVAFTSILIGLKFSAETRKIRGDVDFILEWKESSIGRAALQRLLSEPDKNEGQLRAILAQIEDENIADKIRQALTKLEQRKESQASPKQAIKRSSGTLENTPSQ